ncbi:sensor histidine kinase [Inhella proteolytica]|uniref:Histidine kinase n=1 Tax=Inhella proteolytica TaxID=2795029 RepID=A0A931NG32_9BURK|nr:histidine kinase [Inhella proteolytica]MBH9576736.1 histidine kinase [Inhella proteolytica]
MSASPTFWPRERGLWLYHLGACAAVVGLTLLSGRAWGPISTSLLAATTVWPLPFTAALLLLRWLYLRRDAGALPIGRLVAWTLLACSLAGLAVAAAVQALVLPLTLRELPPGTAPGPLLLRWVVSGGLQAQLFLCAWAFVYIGIDTQRRARAAELVGLRLSHSLREAQLAQLASQLNPHFLFNALNNLRFVVHEDPPRADALVLALSRLLRHSLQGSRRDTLPLAEELEAVRDYLALMRVQLEERLRVDWQLAPGLEQAAVPPMLLQLLVENAIKHGLERLPGGGRLLIALHAEGGPLQIRVRNDCPAPQGPQPGGAPGLGLGLNNLRQRLLLLYGPRAQLEVQAGTGSFEVCVQLPLETA